MATTKKIDMTGAFVAVAGPGGLVTFTPDGPVRWAIAGSTTAVTLERGHSGKFDEDKSLEMADGEYLQIKGGSTTTVAVTAENEV